MKTYKIDKYIKIKNVTCTLFLVMLHWGVKVSLNKLDHIATAL